MPPGAGLAIHALAANVILAACAFFIIPQQFAHEPWLCFTVAVVGCGAALATLFSFLIRDATVVATFLTLIGHGGALIFLFAGIYQGFGLIHDHANAVSASDGLYFSIVTWTTLGYGDFTPPPDIRLIAALEALLGYTFFGIIVGLGTDQLIRRPLRG
jgi:hypothetical protein